MSEEAKKRKGSPDAATVEVRIKLSEAVARVEKAEAERDEALQVISRWAVELDAWLGGTPWVAVAMKEAVIRAALREKP